MKITEMTSKSPELISDLTRIWESSVRKTHDFLSEEEICRIKEYVPEAISGVEHLITVQNDNNSYVGFMGIENGRIEMLFISPDEMGKGLGRSLVTKGIDEYGAVEVTVNEQNPQARGFYEHLGFRVWKRTDLDEQGGPYPLLYMKL